MLALFLSLLSVLPPSEQYAEKSLPAAIAHKLEPTAGSASEPHGGLYGIRRFRDRAGTLWVVTLPCRASDSHACRAVLFLETPKGFREVGKASGELVDADPEAGIPDELSFHVAASKTETQLRWADGGYASKQVPRWFRDPLNRERVDADELRSRGMADLQSGRFTVAAGRFALLCQDPCAVLDVETLATALLEARLFEQAEAALRRAIEMPGHQLQDLTSLVSLLRAEGHEKDALLVEGRLKRESPTPAPDVVAQQPFVAVVASIYDRLSLGGSDLSSGVVDQLSSVAHRRHDVADRRQFVAH